MSHEDVSLSRYVRMIVSNQKLIEEEIKRRRLNSGNACYHSVQNLVFLSAVKKHKNARLILPVVLYRHETSCLTLREKHSLRVFEKGVLRGMLGLKKYGVMEWWRKLHKEELCDL
jgi:hypothetical protein